MKLIAIPYAAGTAFAFQTLQNSLKPYVKLEVFEYPGHGQKMWRPLKDNFHEIAREMLKEMFPIEEPYCLLGYSMGGHVLCELYRLLVRNRFPLPIHVFLCASDIPNQQPGEATNTSDEALRKDLMELGGTAPEILENQEFMDLLLPIYRADILAERNYVLPYEKIFKCDGTVIVGKAEMNENCHFSDWQRYFFKPIRFCEINGGHFFIQEEPEAFTMVIKETLKRIEELL